MSGKITKYCMLVGLSAYDLIVNVQTAMESGWKLYGTPFARGTELCQAMVKEEYHNNKEVKK